MRSRLRSVPVLAAFAVVTLFAAGCGGDDDSGSSSDTTTTTGATSTTSDANASAIEALQQELDTLGCGAGTVDGQLGPETEAAIKHFQTAAGLTVDGIVGTNTRAALAEAAQSGSPNCESTPPPSTSAGTTTTTGGEPPCEANLINAAVAASLESGTVVVNSGPFECAGVWAYAEPNVGPSGGGGQDDTITVLLHWTGQWQAVDRATYCEGGQLPPVIQTGACDSN